MSILRKYLGFKTETGDVVAETAERVETVTEFLGDVSEKLPDLLDKAQDAADRLPDLFSDAIEASAPWFTVVVDSVGEALPPVKAVLSIAKFLTRETDPHALGLLAVSLAYQAALADAAKEIARDQAMRVRLAGRKPVRRLPRGELGEPETPDAFAGFQIKTALSHPLVRRADNALTTVATAAGYPEEVVRALLEGVHVRFAETFSATISDGRVKEKFDPLFRLLELHGLESPTYAFLRRHVEYQLWRFTKVPALGKGGKLTLQLPMAKIFTPLDCGVLKWGEIHRESRTSVEGRRWRSPFDEGFGGRSPLLDTVIDLIGDPRMNEAIVVQGTAGAGKSAFTLQLCQALRDRFLRPIRVRMRDLSLDPGITLIEDLARALTLNCGDDEFDKQNGPCPSATTLDFKYVLDETVRFGQVTMCPYVFIFDGWDEISISASEGFRIQIEKTLHAVRHQLLNGRPHLVRVVLTGRPSEDVNQAKFLSEGTPVLTVRPFNGPQLRNFVAGLLEHMQTDTMLPSPALRRVDELLEQFDNDEADTGGKSILGLPLLALLAIWLVLNDKNPPDELIAERSSLYRRLVDLTTRYGGNVEPLAPGANKITGEELRALLQRTAAAMTLRGTEQISYSELTLRLEADGLTEPETVIGQAVLENKIPKLMLSFFFNVGQQGCEFIHKTFREYLFAEAVVEALKRNATHRGEDRRAAKYWKEFEDGDPRKPLVEELGPMLLPHWIQPEVWRHLAWLIGWEVERSVSPNGVRRSEEESSPLELRGWEVVRDRLVDLWGWWGEGVHMRAQPYREKGKTSVNYNPPFALRLAEQIAPVLPLGTLPEPVRLTTLDAHLGDALLRLNCTLHFRINKATGWLHHPSLSGLDLAEAIWKGAESSPDSGRHYQTCIRQDKNTWWAFAPSSPDGENHYFENYFARINAAGWYPGDRFPYEVDFSGTDFRRTPLRALAFGANRFAYARLDNADCTASYFEQCDFTSVSAFESSWLVARLQFWKAPSLDNFDLRGADFENCLIAGVFSKAAQIAPPPHYDKSILVWDDGEASRFKAENGKGDDHAVLPG